MLAGGLVDNNLFGTWTAFACFQEQELFLDTKIHDIVLYISQMGPARSGVKSLGTHFGWVVPLG